jgi:protein-tyrosine kinase
MTRVAKARRKAGEAGAEAPFADAWGLGPGGGADVQPPPGVDAGGAGPGEPIEPDEEEAMRIKSALRPDVQEHLLGLVRRVFLPPPLGAGARTVLFAAADGGRDDSASCVQAAELLSRQTARTVCLVDAGGSLLSDDGDEGRPHAEVSRAVEPLFRLARPLTRNLWRAPDSAAPPPRHTVEDAKRWFADLASRFDYVLLDAEAMRAPGQPSLLASMVEGVILVVDERETRRATARSVAAELQQAGARLLGVVLTNRSFPIPDEIYRRM